MIYSAVSEIPWYNAIQNLSFMIRGWLDERIKPENCEYGFMMVFGGVNGTFCFQSYRPKTV